MRASAINRSEATAAADRPGSTITAPPGQRRRVVTGALLFVLGFTAVFVSFGALFGGLGRLLLEWAPLLTRLMGVVTIIMGLAFLGGLHWLQRERRITRRPPAGLLGAPVLGVVFGLGWTPCLGPTLSAVNTLAYTEASAARGAVLGLAYCLGLGIPFVLVALGARRAPHPARHPAGHRRLGPHHGVAALLAGFHRLRHLCLLTVERAVRTRPLLSCLGYRSITVCCYLSRNQRREHRDGER